MQINNLDKKDKSEKFILMYLEFLRFEKLLSENTIQSYTRDIYLYKKYLVSKKIDILSISYENVLNFLETIYLMYTETTVSRILSTIRSFYKFLLREKIISLNPFVKIKNPKLPRKMIRVLEEKEVIKILESIPYSSVLELRNRSMIELLYSCGLRVSEIVNLKLNDIDFDQGIIRFIGKGNKERILPMGQAALEFLKKYIFASRKKLKKNINTDHVFLNKNGKGISRQGFWKVLKQYSIKLNIDKNIYPHIFRHSYATHMLERGADLRVVQELLGHSSVSTTEIYTNISKRHIKDTYFKFHPRNKEKDK